MHAVILVVLKCLFILVCRSKCPTGLKLHVVLKSTQNFYVYAYSTMRNAPCVHPRLDSILKLCQTFTNELPGSMAFCGY